MFADAFDEAVVIDYNRIKLDKPVGTGATARVYRYNQLRGRAVTSCVERLT